MSPRATRCRTRPTHGGARPGAGRPRTLEPPAGVPEIRVRLDAPSGLALLRYRAAVQLGGEDAGTASGCVRNLLAAWGDSAEVRAAVEAWRASR